MLNGCYLASLNAEIPASYFDEKRQTMMCLFKRTSEWTELRRDYLFISNFGFYQKEKKVFAFILHVQSFASSNI